MQGPITLNLKFPISKNSVLKTKNLFPEIDQNRQKKDRGAAPYPRAAHHLPPSQVGVTCLAAVALDNQDRVLRPGGRNKSQDVLQHPSL